jgi:hypothetical protein
MRKDWEEAAKRGDAPFLAAEIFSGADIDALDIDEQGLAKVLA